MSCFSVDLSNVVEIMSFSSGVVRVSFGIRPGVQSFQDSFLAARFDFILYFNVIFLQK